jgi:hypothetical protein
VLDRLPAAACTVNHAKLSAGAEGGQRAEGDSHWREKGREGIGKVRRREEGVRTGGKEEGGKIGDWLRDTWEPWKIQRNALPPGLIQLNGKEMGAERETICAIQGLDRGDRHPFR